jgi:hypothetical protein
VGCKEDLRTDEKAVAKLKQKEQKAVEMSEGDFVVHHLYSALHSLNPSLFFPLSLLQGVQLANEVRAHKFMECSAKTQKGMDLCFFVFVFFRPPPCLQVSRMLLTKR